MNQTLNRRVLVIDDQAAIHDDFRKILSTDRNAENLSHLEQALFGDDQLAERCIRFEMDSARQGQEGLAMVEAALKEGRPYALAFVDVRMPPGWDGAETVTHLWRVCPSLQIVICTAYTDYSWQEMMQKLGAADRWVILKKPFDNIEVLQLACSLTEKWNLNRQAMLKLSELETMVDARTRDLRLAHERLVKETEERLRVQDQLRQAQKLESVGQLAAGVAHHFNNLLQIVVCNSGLLLADSDLTPDQQQALRDIETASQQAGNLTRQLLTFSRQQMMRPAWVDLNAVFTNALERLKPELPEAIRLQYAPATGLPQIPGDAALLGQLLTIFVRNARDAMKPGGALTVQTQLATVDGDDAERNPEARPGKYACLTVTDTGVGMDGATMRRLFEPFFTTKALGQGVGLGLATAYGIAQQHHGWIQVESKPGAGTTINVFLPVVSQPSTHAGAASARPTANPGWIARAFQTNAGTKPAQT